MFCQKKQKQKYKGNRGGAVDKKKMCVTAFEVGP